MSPTETERALDNPVWSSLATRHAHFAQGDTLALRYPPDISPLAGLTEAGPASVAALETLVGIGDDIATAGPIAPALPGNWETLLESRVTQMIRAERSPLPEGDVETVTLGPADVDEMLALVALARPGPFRSRGIELGPFTGIRERGQLVAMAGVRMWIGDCREVSGICTHPDAQGRGHARALIGHVVNRMLHAGETPFLHVESTNARAIELYRALGFVQRIENPLLYAKRLR